MGNLMGVPVILEFIIRELALEPVDSADDRSFEVLGKSIRRCRSVVELREWWSRNMAEIQKLPNSKSVIITKVKDDLKDALKNR